MINELIFENIFTITPLILGMLIALLVITKKLSICKSFTISLIVELICVTLFLYSYSEWAFFILNAGNLLIVISIVFIMRKKSVEDLKDYNVILTIDAKTLLEDITEELRVNNIITHSFVDKVFKCVDIKEKKTNNNYIMYCTILNTKIVGLGNTKELAQKELKEKLYYYIINISKMIKV